MIITKTPFRMSFAGGGTDMSVFYDREEGAVVSTGIDKFMYLAIHRYFEDSFVLKYSKTETVSRIEDIQHPLIRQAFLKTGVREHLEVTSFADIPSKGSGLGSSSAFTCGLLKALYAFDHKNVDNSTIARQACEIEINELGAPIGMQDQYACAVGGFNLIRFLPGGNVAVEPIPMKRSTLDSLQDRLLMFYTGTTRQANGILEGQKRAASNEDKFQNLRKMRDLAYTLRDSLLADDVSGVGRVLHEGWMLKKELAQGITSPEIDLLYEKARALGAGGGKILGAGGGGFLLLYSEPQHHPSIREGLGLRELRFKFEPQGSRIIFLDGEE